MSEFSLSPIDWVILAAYFAVIFGIGFYFARKERTSTEYFLAGRHVGWFAVGASLFASNIGSEHILGLAGSGASDGMAVGHYEWLACLILLVLGFVFVPFYMRSNVFTMPEFLERRYNSACRTYLASVSLAAYIVTKIAVALFAGSLVLKAILGWDNLWFSSLFLVVATGIYTVAGGLSAVVYTEVIQSIILIVGSLILAFMGLQEVGGFAGLREALPPEYFHMWVGKGIDHPSYPWTGIVFGAPILGIWYWCTDQVIVQRVLGAKDEANAKLGTILAGFLKILPVFMLVVPGMCAKVLFEQQMTVDGHMDSNLAFPVMVTGLLPVGIRGIVIAALLAALMSSLAAVFNSSSTLVTMDFYKKMNPAASEATLVNVGRWSTVVLVFLGILTIPLIPLMDHRMFVALQSIQAYVSPPIAAVFLFGVFWPRATGAGAFASLITGAVLGLIKFGLEIASRNAVITEGFLKSWADFNFLHYAIFMFIVCAAVLIGVSLVTAAPDRNKLAGLTWATVQEKVEGADTILEEETPAQRTRNLVAALLLIATLIGLWTYFA